MRARPLARATTHHICISTRQDDIVFTLLDAWERTTTAWPLLLQSRIAKDFP
jgi:hypothetical protein